MWRMCAAIVITVFGMLVWGLSEACAQGRLDEVMDSAAERQAGVNGARFGRDFYGRYRAGYRGWSNAGYFSPAYQQAYNFGYANPGYPEYPAARYSTYYRGASAVPQYPAIVSGACSCH